MDEAVANTDTKMMDEAKSEILLIPKQDPRKKFFKKLKPRSKGSIRKQHEAQIKIIEASLQDLIDVFSDKSDQLAIGTASREKLEKTILSLTERFVDLETSMALKDEEIFTQTAMIRQLMSDNAAQKDYNEELSAEKADLVKTIEDNRQTSSEVTQAENAQSESLVVELKAGLEGLKRTLEENNAAWAEERNGYKKSVNGYKSDLEIVLNQRNDLNQRIDECKRTMEEQGRMVSKLEADVAKRTHKLKERCLTLGEVLDTWDNDRTYRSKKNQELRVEIGSLKEGLKKIVALVLQLKQRRNMDVLRLVRAHLPLDGDMKTKLEHRCEECCGDEVESFEDAVSGVIKDNLLFEAIEKQVFAEISCLEETIGDGGCCALSTSDVLRRVVEILPHLSSTKETVPASEATSGSRHALSSSEDSGLAMALSALSLADDPSESLQKFDNMSKEKVRQSRSLGTGEDRQARNPGSDVRHSEAETAKNDSDLEQKAREGQGKDKKSVVTEEDRQYILSSAAQARRIHTGHIQPFYPQLAVAPCATFQNFAYRRGCRPRFW